MILTIIGFLLIAISATYAIAAYAVLEEKPPPAEKLAEKLRISLAVACVVLVVGLIFLRSLPMALATIGTLLLVLPLRWKYSVTLFIAVTLMGLSIVIQYSWVLQPSS